MKKGRTSLLVTFASRIAAAALFMALFSFGVFGLLEYQRSLERFEVEVGQLEHFAHEALEHPLWNIDQEAIEKLGQALMRHELVSELRVSIADEELFRESDGRCGAGAAFTGDCMVRQLTIRSDFGEVLGHLWLGFHNGQARAELLGMLVRQFVITLLVILAILAIFMLIFRRQVFVPLTALDAAARAIASRQLNVRVPVDRNDEIGHLAASLEHMRGRIRDMLGVLEQHNLRLEDEVERRTAELRRTVEQLHRYQNELENLVSTKVSELRQKDELLLQQSRQVAMAELLQRLAHQWRNPLNVVGLTLQNIEDDFLHDSLNSQDLHEMVEEAMRTLTQLSETIDDFRILFGNEESGVRPVQLDMEVRSLKPSLDMLASGYGIELALELESCQVQVDPRQLRRALMNLVLNSIESLERQALQSGQSVQGRILVCVLVRGSSCCLEVWDTGPGIAASMRVKVFDPYHSTKASSGDRPVGIGLGLPSARAFVREAGGDMSFDDGDAGFCVRLCLPLYAERAALEGLEPE